MVYLTFEATPLFNFPLVLFKGVVGLNFFSLASMFEGVKQVFGRGGLDPRKMKRMMRQMGIKMEELEDVEEVIIRMSDRELVIPDAEVSITEMKGQKTYQIMGETQERQRETKSEISAEDTTLVAEQANVDKDAAKKALEETNGDIAQTILNLKKEE